MPLGDWLLRPDYGSLVSLGESQGAAPCAPWAPLPALGAPVATYPGVAMLILGRVTWGVRWTKSVTMDSIDLLERLKAARWYVAARTIGNDHSTLVGLLVDWWITLGPGDHWVLEGGPGNGYTEAGARGQCDALFCRGSEAVGVLEVEGSRYVHTVRKLGSFFAARIPEYATLRFGVLVVYTYEPEGIGQDRRLPVAVTPETLREVEAVTRTYPDHAVAVVTVDKRYVRQKSGLRARNEYYFGEPNQIRGLLYRGGRQVGSESFLDGTVAS